MTRELATLFPKHIEIKKPRSFYVPFFGYITLPEWVDYKTYFITPKGYCLSEPEFFMKARLKAEKRKLNSKITNPYS